MRIEFRYYLMQSLFILGFMYAGQAQNPISQTVTTLKEHMSAAESGNAQFGISIRQLDGDLDYAYQGDTRLIPASTLKIVTTLSSMEILGPDFKFETKIGYSGELLGDGTLMGDLVVIGSGDPSLASPEYPGALSDKEVIRQIIEALIKGGVTCIEGNIVGNDGIFDRQMVHPSWSWDDLTNYYASGTRGINWHENLYFLSFSRSVREGQATRIESINPFIPGLEIENQVRTGPENSGDNAYIYGDPYRHERVVEGTIPPGRGIFRIKGAIPDPPMVFVQQMASALERVGIGVMGEKVENEPSNKLTKTLLVIESPGLKELVKYANTKSNNLFCEAFLKKIGAQIGVGSYKNGQKTLEEHLKLIGVPVDGWHQQDGSGLSARNRLSPNFLTAFLAIKSKRLGQLVVKDLLPKAGKEGTVQSFLNGFSAQQHAWLKSGSINHVLTYAGILETKKGNEKLIAVMANGHSSNGRMRRQIEKIIQVIYEDL